MNMHFKTVVNYVKNLFAGCAPVAASVNPEMDAKVLSRLSLDNFYIVAQNGRMYWYCRVRYTDIPIAKHIIRSNGLKVSTHYSKFTCSRILRVNTDCLVRNPSGKQFVSVVMNKKAEKLDDRVYESYLRKIRQKVM